MEIDENRLREIIHARHREVLFHTLHELCSEWAAQCGLDIRRQNLALRSYDGQILGHTIAEQALLMELGFANGEWMEVSVASTGPKWDALVLVTSSKQDTRDVVLSQSESMKSAIDAAKDAIQGLA